MTVSAPSLPVVPADDELRGLLRSALTEPTRHHGVNPVAVFISIHPALTAFLRQAAPTIESVVHLSQELRLHGAPLVGPVPSEQVQCRLLDVKPDPRGSRVTVWSRLGRADGTAAATSLSTVLLGGVDPSSLHLDKPLGLIAPVHAAPAPGVTPRTETAEVTSAFSATYAAVSCDDNPIHVDEAAARAAGFSGPIAHGMSIVALALEMAADEWAQGDVSRITGFGVRFSAPVLCGSEIAVTVAPTETTGLYALCATSSAGTALKAAWVEIPDGTASRAKVALP